MTIRETAAYLSGRGYRCGPGTVRSLCAAGRLRYYRVGSARGRIEVPAAEADRFLRAALHGGNAPASQTRPRPAPRATPRKPGPVAPTGTAAWKARLDDLRKR